MIIRRVLFLLFYFLIFSNICVVASPSQTVNILNPLIKIQNPTDIHIPFIPSDTEKGLPSFGVDSDLPSYQEQQMGKAFIQYIRATAPILHDPLVSEYVTSLGYQLVANSPRPAQPYYFFVVNRHDINAFSGPDGYVGVYSGLILETQTRGELAAVLAHEIAHVSQRHIMRMVEDAKRAQLVSLGTLLAAIAVGVANPLAGISMAAASSAGGAQHMINFIRGREKEADRIGIQILAKSGFDPRNMPDFFKRMSQYAEMNTGDIPAILQTHPVTAVRLSDAYDRCELYPKYPKKRDKIFPLIQARVAVALSSDSDRLVQQYQEKLAHLRPKTSKRHRLFLQYAYALALLKDAQAGLASRQINQLIHQYPNQWIFKMTQVRIEVAQKKYRSALKNIQTLYRDYPDSYPILLTYAQVLLKMKQFSAARELLESHELDYQDRLSFLHVLYKSQGYSNHKSQAYETRAKICLIYDNMACVRDQLQMARQFAKNNDQKRRINAKLCQTPAATAAIESV